MFCRLRCALRSSIEPSTKLGSLAAILRSLLLGRLAVTEGGPADRPFLSGHIDEVRTARVPPDVRETLRTLIIELAKLAARIQATSLYTSSDA